MFEKIEEFDKFIEKEPEDVGYRCVICFGFRKRSRSDVRNHIESKHFPNTFSYTCFCEAKFGTNTALTRHKQRFHREQKS